MARREVGKHSWNYCKCMIFQLTLHFVTTIWFVVDLQNVGTLEFCLKPNNSWTSLSVSRKLQKNLTEVQISPSRLKLFISLFFDCEVGWNVKLWNKLKGLTICLLLEQRPKCQKFTKILNEFSKKTFVIKLSSSKSVKIPHIVCNATHICP